MSAYYFHDVLLIIFVIEKLAELLIHKEKILNNFIMTVDFMIILLVFISYIISRKTEIC